MSNLRGIPHIRIPGFWRDQRRSARHHHHPRRLPKADSGDRSRTQPANADVRRDRIRWGAVWTGALTTLSIYIVLQLLFFALGWLDLGINGAAGGTTRAVVSGVLGLIAFFLGGVAAGASALWHRANDGMVNGVVTWTATVLVLADTRPDRRRRPARVARRRRHPVRRSAQRGKRDRHCECHPDSSRHRRLGRPQPRTVRDRQRPRRLHRSQAVARPRPSRFPPPLITVPLTHDAAPQPPGRRDLSPR